jgi:murein DD-endopeptidase MepM/ murein hydrolase activator NlpD
MIQLKNILVEQSNLLKTFPIGSKNFNVGYDAASMGKDTMLARDTAIHNSDYGSGDSAHRSRGGHKGIDIFAPSGEPVVACVTGTVVNVSKKDKGAGGLTVTIEKNGISYYYAHMSNVYVDLDQSVESGQLIGTCGNTGNASGTHPHVHFSIYKTKLGYNNGSIDPWPSLKDVLYTVTKSDKNIEELHLKLKKLGFNLGNEAENGTNGPKTQEALKKLAKKYQNAKNNGNWSASAMSFIANIFKSKTVKSIFGGKNDEIAPENSQTAVTAVDVSMMPNRIILFFKNKGLTTSQAAGIAGNIAVESQFNPNAVGDSGTSFGLAQWHGDNGDRLKQWTAKNGYEWNSIDGQLQFLWYQLQHTQSAALIALRKQKTPRDAAYVFAQKFERPASISNNRMENAEKFYNEYTKNATKTI